MVEVVLLDTASVVRRVSFQPRPQSQFDGNLIAFHLDLAVGTFSCGDKEPFAGPTCTVATP